MKYETGADCQVRETDAAPSSDLRDPYASVPDRVLVIIDDDLRLGEVVGLLDRHGVVADATDDPYAAEDWVFVLPRHRVIVLDVLLPTREVYRLCRRIRRWTDVPMVIASWEDRPGPGAGPVDRLVAHSSTAAELVADVLSLLGQAARDAGIRDWPAGLSAGEPEASPAPGGQM